MTETVFVVKDRNETLFLNQNKQLTSTLGAARFYHRACDAARVKNQFMQKWPGIFQLHVVPVAVSMDDKEERS